MGQPGFMSFDDLVNYKPQSSGKFFSLKNGEEARIRFLYNGLEEIGAYIVHEFTNPYATIACARDDSQPNDVCPWCAQGNTRVRRVIFPIFNLEENEIQYWKRTAQFAKEKVIPMLQEVASQNQPLSSMIYKIKRMGDGRDTTYTVVPTGMPDGQRKEVFGQVEDPFDLNMIRESNYNYVSGAQQPQNNYNNLNNYNNQNNNYGQNGHANQTHMVDDQKSNDNNSGDNK